MIHTIACVCNILLVDVIVQISSTTYMYRDYIADLEHSKSYADTSYDLHVCSLIKLLFD